MKRLLQTGLDLLSNAAVGLAAVAAIVVICVATDDLLFSSRTTAVAADQPAEVQASAGKTLVRFSSDGVFLVTVKGGVVVVESGFNLVNAGSPGDPGDPTDPPPDDPPPADLGKAFAAAIAKVKESDKAQTAVNLKAIVDGALVSALNGKLTDIDDVKANMPMVLTLMTMTKPDWSEFSALIKASIANATTIPELVSVLQPASDELGKVK